MKAGLASASVEGLWIINSRGVTVYANEGMAKILGVADASSLIGKDSFQYVFPDDLDAARDLFVEKEAGNRSPFHFRLRRADYVEIWVDVQGTPMHSVAGDFIGIVGSFAVSNLQAKK